MNLIENEEYNKRNKKNKTIMIVIIILIIFLLIICGVLVYLINEVQRNRLKLNVDNVSTNFAEDMFIIDGDTLYVAIKDFASLMGYEVYNGEYKTTRYSEDTTNCYITSANEMAAFSLNSNSIYKKVTANEDFEYFDIDKPVIRRNNKLYISSEGMQIGTNSIITYNATNNQINVYSLDYIVNTYAEQYPNGTFIEEDSDFISGQSAAHEQQIAANGQQDSPCSGKASFAHRETIHTAAVANNLHGNGQHLVLPTSFRGPKVPVAHKQQSVAIDSANPMQHISA